MDKKDLADQDAIKTQSRRNQEAIKGPSKGSTYVPSASPSFVDGARRDESALVGEGTRDACRSRAIEPTVELEVFGEMEYSTYPEPHAGAG
jgi:hypothetical protein